MRTAIGLVLLAGVAMPGVGQNGAATAQEIDLQWAGCWDLENGRSDSEEIEEGNRRVCVESRNDTLTIVTLIDETEARRDELYTDGRPRNVEDGGCTGTEQVVVSGDGHRLYTTADLVCDGGARRRASGISALLAPDSWIDIQVVRVGDERELLVRRFAHNESESSAILARAEGGDLALAARTARTAAASLLEVDDVIEAVRVVDAAAVEALLLESEASFAIDAGVLISLADAEVPSEVIDLMLALSFPDYFVVNEEPATERGSVAYGYPVGFYGYWSPAFAPFGRSYYYYPQYPVGWLPGGRPTGSRFGGRVVNGRGYARVMVNPSTSSGGFANFLRKGGSSVASGGRGGGRGGSGAGTAPPSGSAGGKASSGKTRTAKRRDG